MIFYITTGFTWFKTKAKSIDGAKRIARKMYYSSFLGDTKIAIKDGAKMTIVAKRTGSSPWVKC